MNKLHLSPDILNRINRQRVISRSVLYRYSITIVFLLTMCIDSFSQITLENYYKHCSSYPPNRRMLVSNLEKLDSIYHTDILKDTLLLSKLVYPRMWGPGYVNYFKEPVKEFLTEALVYENVKRNFDLAQKFRRRAEIYALGTVPLGIFFLAYCFSLPSYIANGDSWIESPVTLPLMITLYAIGIPSAIISCSYQTAAEFKLMKLPYEYNGAVIVKNRSD